MGQVIPASNVKITDTKERHALDQGRAPTAPVGV
jgi:hypothetical protein